MKLLTIFLLFILPNVAISQTPTTNATTLVQEILVDAEYPGGFEAMAELQIYMLSALRFIAPRVIAKRSM